MDPRQGRRHVGLIREEEGEEWAISLTAIRSGWRTTLDVIRWRMSHAAFPSIPDRRVGKHLWIQLRAARFGGRRPYLLAPIDLPSNPYAFTLWGAGVTHLRSAKAREEESKAVLGRPASFYDLMYEEGLRAGKPGKVPGSRPEIFFKSDGYWTVGPNQPLRIASTSKRCVPEPEVVSYYCAAPAPRGRIGKWIRLGYSLGNDFSDQGWESENPLYLPHAKVQDGLTSIGPVFVTADDPLFDPAEVAIRCQVFRGGRVFQDCGSLRTGEKHMAHSLANMEFHLFDNRPFRPNEIRGLFWGTTAVFKLPLSPPDRIKIEASSGLDVLMNPTAAA